MRKINVLHIVEDLKIGGMERIIAIIATGLNKEKYNVSLWCLAGGGEIAQELKNKGIKLEILGMGYHCSPPFFLKLVRRMRRSKIDILHAHGYSATAVGQWAAIFAGIPIILSHIHTSLEEYTVWQILIERFLNFFTHRIICCSEAVSQSVKEYFRLKLGKIAVIYNGIEEPDLLEELDSAQIRKEFELSEKIPIVGCVAAFVSHKGHRYLLEAVKIISESQLLESQPLQLLLLGDGPLRERLKEEAFTLGINSRVIFAGIRKDVHKILSIMDIVVLPSCQREGLGVSLIEAMAEGKPLIGTQIGGIPEVIKTGETGILVPPRNSQALAEAIAYLLKDKERRKRMGLAGQRLYKEKFTVQIMLQKIENLYSFLISEKRIR